MSLIGGKMTTKNAAFFAQRQLRREFIPIRFVCLMPSALTRSTSRMPPLMCVCILWNVKRETKREHEISWKRVSMMLYLGKKL